MVVLTTTHSLIVKVEYPLKQGLKPINLVSK